MNSRERFRAIMDFQPFDRLPLLEWAHWWDKTIDRWYTEGLPAELTDADEIGKHFGLESYKRAWYRPYGKVPRGQGRADRQAGILAHVKDYDAARKLMYPDNVLDKETLSSWAAEQESGETVVWIQIEGYFWYPREIFGVERHLYAFFDEPDLMHRMNEDLTEWNLKLLEDVFAVCKPDFVSFAEDLSYNQGPMLSKAHFDEFLRPYYDRIVPLLRKHNVLSVVDSDGDVALPVAWFEEAGIDGSLPLERQAGVDITTLREKHPKQLFIGHYDKMEMSKGEAAMRAEFERLLPVAAKGGFIISCDHQTPPEVSYEDYKLYVSLFREYAEEAGKRSASLKEGGTA